MRKIKIIAGSILTAVVVITGFYYLLPGISVKVMLALQRSAMRVERKEIAMNDGLRYVYLEGGTGEPLLMLHGFGGNKEGFGYIVPMLTDGSHIIAPDHIGFGESSRPVDIDYSPIAQSKRLHELMKKLGIQKYHLAAHSMGGHVALHLAYMYPHEVKSLCLFAPTGVSGAPDTPFMQRIYETNGASARTHSAAEFKPLLGSVFYKEPFVPYPLFHEMASIYMSSHEIHKKIIPTYKQYPVNDLASDIVIPTLIFWGDKDEIVHPESANILDALIPNSTLAMLEETGHTPFMERPEESAKHYLEFRDGIR